MDGIEGLRELRRMMKLDQTAFGEWLGFSRSTVSRWETGRAAPPPAVVILCRLLLQSRAAA